MNPRLLTLAAAAVALAAAEPASAARAQPAADVAAGKTLFSQQCMLCHSDTAGKEGAAPSLYGVVGRKAAADPGFPGYTKALKASNVTWSAATLDKFLSGPTQMVPGTAMPISLANPIDRHHVIAYLASLKKGK